jgi:serine/threonine protein kinase
MERKGTLTEEAAKLVVSQVVVGFDYLYNQRVIHRDLNMDTIQLHFPECTTYEDIVWSAIDLTKTPFTLKICDFGAGKLLDHNHLSDSFQGQA